MTDHIPTETAQYEPEAALKCLHSMPFEPKRAVAYLDDLEKYLQFHSTADSLSSMNFVDPRK